MTKLAKFFYRFLYWLTPWWYGLTQTCTRKKRYPEVREYASANEIPAAINWGRSWRADPWKGILDVQMSPRKFQKHLDDGAPSGDCDDHALYWCTALLRNGLAERAWLATVWYSKPDGSGKEGHVVCVFEVPSGGDFLWADYRAPRRFKGDWGWALDLADSRGKIVHAAGLIEVKLRKSGEPKLCKKVKTFIA